MRTATLVATGIACAVVGAGAQTAAALAVREAVDRGRSVSEARLDAAVETFRSPPRDGLGRRVDAAELDPARAVRTEPSRCAPLAVLALSPALDGRSWTGVNGSPAEPVTTLTVRYATASAARAELRRKQLALVSCTRVELTFPPFDQPAQPHTILGRVQARNVVGDRLAWALTGNGRVYDFYVRRYANTLTWTYADERSTPPVRAEVADSLVARLRQLERQ